MIYPFYVLEFEWSRACNKDASSMLHAGNTLLASYGALEQKYLTVISENSILTKKITSLELAIRALAEKE